MERKIFWLTFSLLGDHCRCGIALLVVGLRATILIFAASWWFAYRSGWF